MYFRLNIQRPSILMGSASISSSSMITIEKRTKSSFWNCSFKTVLKDQFKKLDFVRFSIVAMLLLLMLALPIKMLGRWMFNLKYIVYIPEFFFNI